jgi:hypothetical protein
MDIQSWGSNSTKEDAQVETANYGMVFIIEHQALLSSVKTHSHVNTFSYAPNPNPRQWNQSAVSLYSQVLKHTHM